MIGEKPMPNGPSKDIYNPDWCAERHRKLDRKIETLEARLWGIWILLFGNLCGVGATLMLLLSGNG